MNWYNLPKYYDVSFSHEMQEELAFLKSVFRKYTNSSSPRLLEPACGSGRLIIPLLLAGYQCTGFDLNPSMLAYLKKNCSAAALMRKFCRPTWRISQYLRTVMMAPFAPWIRSVTC